MAKKPHEVFAGNHQQTHEPGLNREDILAIVSSIEEVTDVALSRAKPRDFGPDGSFDGT